MRIFPSILTAFFFVATATAGILVGCQDGDGPGQTEQTGALNLRLKVGDREIATVHYVIARPGSADITGSIDVLGQDVVVERIGGIPVGDNYTIRLDAQTVDGTRQCAGESMPFVVSADVVAPVKVWLSCREVEDGTGTETETETSSTSSDTSSTSETGTGTETETGTETGTDTTTTTGGDVGGIDLDVEADDCPDVDSVDVSNANPAMGETVAVVATAVDPEGQLLAFEWTVDGAVFPAGASINYTCSVAGEHLIGVKISDEHCDEIRDVAISCVE